MCVQFYKMFCADYISAFIYHAGINYGLWKYDLSSEMYPSNTLHYLHGGIAGFLGACTIYPFDFVRKAAITSGKAKLVHNLATVPYGTVFFGLYFHQRNPESLKSQMLWALASAGLAVLAEMPFDTAKRDMMGSSKTVLLANSLFVPFGALILVMYDKAVLKFEKNKNLQSW